MKKAFLLFGLISMTLVFGQSKFESAQKFQDELDMEFGDNETSPLTMEDYVKFEALPFFEIDTNYVVTAQLELTPDDSVITLATSTERLAKYRRYAIARFKLNGSEHQLNVYESMRLKNNPKYQNYLFLPYKDHTNGDETYGGGRYIELEKNDSMEMVIDFNRSFNPYCAYNDKYSCPVVPQENSLETKVEAGVKAPEK